MKSEPGMLSFAEAKAICPLFSAEEQDFNWPSSLPIGDIATLQIPMDVDRHTDNDTLRHALLSALKASLRLGMLPYQTVHSASEKSLTPITACKPTTLQNGLTSKEGSPATM